MLCFIQFKAANTTGPNSNTNTKTTPNPKLQQHKTSAYHTIPHLITPSPPYHTAPQNITPPNTNTKDKTTHHIKPIHHTPLHHITMNHTTPHHTTKPTIQHTSTIHCHSEYKQYAAAQKIIHSDFKFSLFPTNVI